MDNKKTINKFEWLDIIRILSILLVIYGHFASVGGYAPSIPGVVNENIKLPLMNGPEHKLLNFDIVLINLFSTQSAILGVALFFMVTGYLMPLMMEKYSRTSFLINRFFRIFPLLIFSTTFTGIYLYYTQDIHNTFSSYLGSWTLSYGFFGVAPIMGVLWTLVIEVLFYLLTACIGRFSLYRVILLQAFLLILISTAGSISNYYINLIGKQAIFILYILLGTAVYLAEREEKFEAKLAIVSYCLMLCYITMQFFKKTVGSIGTYENLGTHLLAVSIFLGLMIAGRLNLFSKLPKIFTWFADLVYPIYLFHVAIGLSTMALIRNVNDNYLVMLLGGFVASVFVSYLAHKLIEKPFINFGRRFTKRREQKA